MEDIAPEYDVVVLGTGAILGCMTREITDMADRLDGMRPLWVCTQQTVQHQLAKFHAVC